MMFREAIREIRADLGGTINGLFLGVAFITGTMTMVWLAHFAYTLYAVHTTTQCARRYR